MDAYPKWKYHDTEPACVVDDEEAELALGDGWRDTPDNRDNPDEEPADEVAALREQAAAKGIKVDRRWGTERLKREIEG